MRQERSSSLAERLVMIVDGDVAGTGALRSGLRDDGFRVLHARTGEDALSAAAAEQPDMILLELRLPDISGLEVMRCMRIASDVPVIILTTRGEEIDRVVGLELGADDYIRKPFSTREVIARVHAVLRRSAPPPPASRKHDVLRFGSIEIDRTAHHVRRDRVPVGVTPTEFRVLNALAENIDRVMTRGQIIEHASPAGENADRTLDRHISNLRQKIEDIPARPRFILTVVRIGYKLVGAGAGTLVASGAPAARWRQGSAAAAVST